MTVTSSPRLGIAAPKLGRIEAKVPYWVGPAADAERLRDEAGSARQHAAKERGVSNQLSNDRGRQRRTLADECERYIAVRNEDPKA